MSIADVAARTRHPQLDGIRTIFTCTSFKSCFQKSCHAIYMPSTLNVVQFTAYACTLAINARVSPDIRLREVQALPAEKQLCLFQYSAGKKYHDFILSLMAFPYCNICYSPWFWLHKVFKSNVMKKLDKSLPKM